MQFKDRHLRAGKLSNVHYKTVLLNIRNPIGFKKMEHQSYAHHKMPWSQTAKNAILFHIFSLIYQKHNFMACYILKFAKKKTS